MRLFPVIHKLVNALIHAPAGKFGQGGFKAIAAQLGKGVTKNHIIQRKLAELLLAHHRVRDKGRCQNVALYINRQAVMKDHKQAFCQLVKANRGLKSAPVTDTLGVIQSVAFIHDQDRIAKGKRFGVLLRCVCLISIEMSCS